MSELKSGGKQYEVEVNTVVSLRCSPLLELWHLTDKHWKPSKKHFTPGSTTTTITGQTGEDEANCASHTLEQACYHYLGPVRGLSG